MRALPNTNAEKLGEFADLVPTLVQIWTNGRPTPTGTLVPFEGASLRTVTLYRAEGQYVRLRKEVDVYTGESFGEPEAISLEKAAEIAAAMSLAGSPTRPNFSFWRSPEMGETPRHWAQCLNGDATKIIPVSERDTGDGYLTASLAASEVIQDREDFYLPDKKDVEGSFLCLSPPRLGASLVAGAGILFLSGLAEEEDSPEGGIITDAIRVGSERIALTLEKAWV